MARAVLSDALRLRRARRDSGSTIPDKTLEKGLALYDALIEFHRADENIDARAMAELGRAEYILGFDNKPAKVRNTAFAEFVDGFLKEYDGRTEVVAIVAARKARMLSDEHADGYVDLVEKSRTVNLVAAHDLAAAYAAKPTLRRKTSMSKSSATGAHRGRRSR